MDEFAHGGTDNGFAVFALGLEAFAERLDGVMVSLGRQRGHVQDRA